MDFTGGINKLFSAIKGKRDGDLVDRINYTYTTGLLLMSAVFLGSAYWSTVPMKCWFPAYFKGWWEEYAHDFCFAQSTYFVPMYNGPHDTIQQEVHSHIQIPNNSTMRGERRVSYYQWVIFVIALQALTFYIPVVIWRSLNTASGYFVDVILTEAAKADNLTPEKRKKNMASVARYMTYTKLVYKAVRKSSFVTGHYISGLYLFVKLLYCVNVVGQFLVLNAFLGYNSYSWWGFGILRDISRGRSWEDSGHFPRVTMCDFKVRELANVHHHTIQCALPYNMFNEKIFIFFWWWFLLVAAINIGNFIHWIFTMASGGETHKFLSGYLAKIDRQLLSGQRRSGLVMEKEIRQFSEKFLETDGVLMLRLVACNAGDLVCADLVEQLWTKFQLEVGPTPTRDDSPTKSEDTMPLMPRGPPRYDESQLQESPTL